MKTTTKGQRLKAARDAIVAAQEAQAKLVAAEFPPGKIVRFRRGRGDQDKVGRVLMTGNDRIKIANDATGKEYWITEFDVRCATGDV